ncbi:helix-turn-helix transcriptional regulator [Micromonospora sp. NPDC127501]|uniref:helix-turn-helix domain-containing protein n=1 Tax=Micromonospora sp. NPDC127501 TaxID=3154872 RepID=UPI003318129B
MSTSTIPSHTNAPVGIEPPQATTSGTSSVSLGKWTNIAVVFALAASAGATANTGRRVAADLRQYADSSSSSAVFLASKFPACVETPERPPVAQTVRKLYDEAGLTWEQLARLFGVSRRAVHNWANGGKMTARHVEILAELTRAISALPTNTPSERRELFLAPARDGMSPYDHFRSAVNSSRSAINRAPLTPAQLLGATHDDD